MKIDLAKAVREGKTVEGIRESLKAIKSGKASKIIIAANCPDSIKNKLKDYEVFEGNGKELGVACGKPYSIAVLAITK